MTEEQVQSETRRLVAAYAMLQQDLAGTSHDPDARNLCSAVLTRGWQIVGFYLSYSSYAALSPAIRNYYELVQGTGPGGLINRGGMQDLHTEIRLINHLYQQGQLTKQTTVNFFSTRSVCNTCRSGIMWAMQTLQVPFVPFELKFELNGITDDVYPTAPLGTPQYGIRYA